VAPSERQEGVVALQGGVELVHLQLGHEAVKAATLGRVAHLLGGHGHKRNVRLEVREARDGRLRDRVCRVVAVEGCRQQVEARSGGVGLV
jgi:hypothetical protein